MATVEVLATMAMTEMTVATPSRKGLKGSRKQMEQNCGKLVRRQQVTENLRVRERKALTH